MFDGARKPTTKHFVNVGPIDGVIYDVIDESPVGQSLSLVRTNNFRLAK